MGHPLIKPRINQLYKTYTEQLLTDLSKRNVFFIVMPPLRSQCPNCLYDAAMGAGTGIYNGVGPQTFNGTTCPICENIGFLVTEQKIQIPCNVQYVKGDNKPDIPMPEGQMLQKNAKVKTFVRYHDQLILADHFLIDGVRYKRFTVPRKRGLQNYVVSEFIAQRDD